MKDINLDEIDNLIDTLEGRVSNINTSFKSEEFKKSVENWREQRNSLRESLLEFWTDNDEKNKFINWWKSLNKEYRTAMILTSIDDLKQSLDLYDNYSPIAAPELQEDQMNYLLLDQVPKDESDTTVYDDDDFFKPKPTPTLIKLIQDIVDSKENDTKIFTGLNRMKLFFSDLDDPQFAVQSFLVVRSCILAGFMVNIIVLFNSQLEEEEEAEAEGEQKK
ncbi:hypothetical protein DICPUDRAFT_158939 [Dictyostelium purpureum]|uniref:Uncharacterized protein n=1 Tax=Dictyostelium purpureum TaxID=5786 RepID=F1A2V9_DICPU|nr:uncharacterized protein DICPUDRAFT_158939 [Dictyostelium purpureum]EGC29476.1 hypothetical protein DICPUDRAFT_158939 [Dictyostelium purpureum]|eukprot:XP_003294005.1 hypothetical protein DICPUDRAFT_158939 [Dictyostelium purpureum]